jgi:predicted DNA-binding transcriptional regulator AlpA
MSEASLVRAPSWPPASAGGIVAAGCGLSTGIKVGRLRWALGYADIVGTSRRSRPGPGVSDHRRGRSYGYICILPALSDGSEHGCNLRLVPRSVVIDDLLDARGVADVLGVARHNTVSVYQHRYADMPRPVIDLGKGRVKLWLRPEIERWAAEQAARGRRRRSAAR